MLDFTPKYIPSNVYIYNMSEDVWPFIQAISSEKKQEFEISENANICDRDLFTCADEDNTLFIFPKEVPEEFLSYYKTLFDKKNIRVVVPKVHSGVICEDIMHDEHVMQEIMHAANGAKRLVMRSYTTSQQFIDLVQLLRDKGLSVFTPEAPEEEDSWTVNFFGSKSGIRQLAQQSRAAEPDFIMPEGHIVTGIVDTAKIAAKKYINEHGVVLKTNKGHSGAGVLIFRDGDLPSTYEACEIAILSALKKDAYWNMFPIVVESFISVNPSIGGGFPNVEFQILKNGHVEFLYYCSMRVSDEGVFKGVEINNEVLSDHVSARIVDTGFFIGEQYRAAGYRGYYDVDFVAARNGQLYVTESNVRRTGGTHVYELAMRLFGKDFLYSTYILSNNAYKLPDAKSHTTQSLLGALEPIAFDKKKKEGVIVASVNLLAQNEFAYIVFGETKRRAYEIEQKMEQILQS